MWVSSPLLKPLFPPFWLHFLFLMERDVKMPPKMISIDESHAKNLFAGLNAQQATLHLL